MKLIRKLLCYKQLRIIVKCCFERINEGIEKSSQFTRIMPENRKLYKRMIEGFLYYIQNLEIRIRNFHTEDTTDNENDIRI